MSTAPATVVVAEPSRGGPVSGTTVGSDQFVWSLFTQFTAPVSATQVAFETWASDRDTFSTTPRWPSAGEPKTFQRSVLGAFTTPDAAGIDVPCATPGNAAVGGFPTVGPPKPCIAEEVRRNRAQFDYIVANGLNTKAGLAAAYARSFAVVMPTSALSVKVDWVPVLTMLQWLPQLGSVEKLRTLYYTTTSGGVEYALVAIHVSSRQNANWVWGSFEHFLTPGRCDDIGCFDAYGAAIPAVLPNRATVNTQYGACAKTTALKQEMISAGLSPVWQNYCMKSTMVDYSAPDGTPYALGNSVIERITGNGAISASSCIGCHVYASFDATGAAPASAKAMLPYNPTGPPIPAVLEGAIQFDFMWGVLKAP